MVVFLVQLAIVGLWAAVLCIHTRRLLRLAKVEVAFQSSDQYLRHRLERVWWWLGREEFWHAVHIDGLRCTQMTIMVFLMAWGAYF